MNVPLLLDVPPAPVPVVGTGSRIALATLVLFLAIILIGGTFLLIKRIKRRRANLNSTSGKPLGQYSSE